MIKGLNTFVFGALSVIHSAQGIEDSLSLLKDKGLYIAEIGQTEAAEKISPLLPLYYPQVEKYVKSDPFIGVKFQKKGYYKLREKERDIYFFEHAAVVKEASFMGKLRQNLPTGNYYLAVLKSDFNPYYFNGVIEWMNSASQAPLTHLWVTIKTDDLNQLAEKLKINSI